VNAVISPFDPWLSRTPVRALVVDPEQGDGMFLASTLTLAGLHVTATASFESARWHLMSRPPSVLVTERQLGSDNGLHLALLGRSLRPNMVQLVTSRVCDHVLLDDADAVGATCVRKPMTAGQLLAALYRTALREPNADGTLCPAGSPPDRGHRRPRRAAQAGEQKRRQRMRGRDTFLFLEAWRRSM
jgi:DNA-binding response OmpR family regulator